MLYKPYAEPKINFMYNLLFCDELSLFKNNGNAGNSGIWSILLAEKPDKVAIRKVAEDETNEGRVRALGYNQLRAIGENVPPKKLFGVIIEVPLEQGLDVLAVFSEGGIRYINQSGKLVIFEGNGHPLEAQAKELVSTALPIVQRIGPWEKQRLPPPVAGNVRLTFLVSDGLYFGEGPFKALQQDQLAGPVLAKAAQLLQRVVEAGSSEP